MLRKPHMPLDFPNKTIINSFALQRATVLQCDRAVCSPQQLLGRKSEDMQLPDGKMDE